MIAARIIQEPRSEAVTLNEVKDFLRFTGTSQDAVFTDLIPAAREEVERLLGIATVSRRYQAWLDDSESRSPIILPHAPALGVVSVASYDEDGTETVNAAATYRLAGTENPRLVAVGAGWASGRTEDSVLLKWDAGYEVRTLASGAGAASTALTLADTVASAALTGKPIYNDSRAGADAWSATTISDADGTTGLTLSTAQTWSDGDVIRYGKVPARLKTFLLQTTAMLALERMPFLGTGVDEKLYEAALARLKSQYGYQTLMVV